VAVAVVDVQVRSAGAVNSLRQINTASKEAQSALEGLKRAAAGLALIQVGRQAVQAAASFNDLQLRLKLLTAQYGETAKVQQFAAESARRFGLSNREAAEGVTNIYARLKPLGVSLRDIQSTFTGFNTVARLSGVAGAEASAAFTQLAQALGSGRLQGDEFRSISELVPGILVAISQQTGVAAGDLKEYAKEGKLTSEVVVAALRRIETEGAGKIAQIIQQSDIQKFKNFQNAVDDLQIAIGNELLPIVAPLVRDITGLVRAITGLPEPVKNATVELIRLGVQVLVVKKAFEAIIAIRFALVGSLVGTTTALAASGAAATTSASAFNLYTNNAKTLAAQSAAASGKVNPLIASLQSLAAIGVITVAINLAVSGLQEYLQVRGEIDRLRGQRGKGGAAAAFGGTAPAQSKQVAQQTLKAIQAERQRLQSPGEIAKGFLGPLAPLVGGMGPAARGERRVLLGEREAFARGVLGLPTRAETSGTTLPTTPLGAGEDDKKKKGKKPRESQVPELTRELSLLQQQTQLQGLLAQAAVAKNKEDQIRLEGIGRETELLYQAFGIEQSSVPLAEKQLGIAKIAEQLQQSQIQTAQELAQYDLQQRETGVERVKQLMDEQELLQAKLRGNEAEVILRQQLRDILKDTKGLNEGEVQAILERNEALKRQAEQAEQLKQIYADVGNSIKSGVVEAIQGAIDGTKTLQEVATNLLSNIANKLFDVAVNFALFGAMSGTGTGGGLLGGLFKPRANGGSVMAGQGYLVGERGPELFMPGRSGGIAPTGSFGGAGNIVVNVDANGSNVQGDGAQANALGKAIGIAVQQELIKQKRPGGLLA
jgi:tape measure domain-containing protein